LNGNTAAVCRAILLPFVAGVTIESACVLWVHFSERGFAGYTALCSMLVATAQVMGLSDALLSKQAARVAFVAGYGCGTFATVYLKTKGWSF
jgi:hypothetical protein